MHNLGPNSMARHQHAHALHSGASAGQDDGRLALLRAVHEERMFFLTDDRYAMRPGSQVDLAMEQIRGHVQSVASASQ